MNHRYPDLIGVLLTIYGLYTTINSALYSFIDKLFMTSHPSLTLIFFSLIGFLVMLIIYIKPVRSIPIALYGITMFDISLIYAYRWIYIYLTTRTGVLKLLLTPSLIYILIALLTSIIILSVRGLRTPINIMYSTSFVKLFFTSLIFFAPPIIYLQGVVGIGFKLPKMNLIQFLTLAIFGSTIMIILFYYGTLSLIARSGGGYKGKRRLPHLSESYPPMKIDDKPTYYKVSDLHARVYRIYRVYRGELSQQTIEELLRRLRKITIYYGLDGYVYIYLLSEAYRLGKAVEKINLAENILTRSLHADIVEEDRGNMLKLVKETSMPRDIPEQIDRDRLRFLVNEENLGLILVYEYSGSMSEGRYTPKKIYVKSGLYTTATEIGNHKHLTELKSGYKISSAQASVYSWDLMRQTTPVEVAVKHTPLNLRRGRIHIDGSKQLVGNISIELPKICIDIPLKHHIFFLGKTRSGKSVGIADTVKYINSLGDRKIIIFDWVGNFIFLKDILKNATVVHPGEDVFIDLYKIFNRREIVDVYEEVSILFFKDVERASFSPIAYDMLTKTIEKSNSHEELIEKLENIKEMSTYRDERDASAAILRRIRPLNPDLYTPMEDVEGDLLKLLEKYDVVNIDLASLPTKGDQILFTLASLKVLMRSWSSSKPELYVVIDEAHRLAPKIRGMREWVLSRVAREGGKYNIYLTLADQTLTSVSPDVWSNMGHIFLFHLDNPDDLRIIHPLFSAWEKRYKLSSHTLEEFIDSRLRLNQGECYLVKFGGESEPIPAYFEHTKLVETGEYKKIDERRFREVLEELDVYNLPNPKQDVRKAIIISRKLIRKYEVLEIVDKLKTFIFSNLDTLTVNGLILAVRENGKVRIRLPFRIFLVYHNMPYTVEEIEARPFK